MLLRKKMTIVGLAAVLVLGLATFGTIALAQQTGTSAQNPVAGAGQARRAKTRRGMRRREMGGMFRVLNQLNLTAEQKQQARSIMQTNLQSTKAQRQELRQLTQQWRQGSLAPESLARAKELRLQMAESRKGVRTQLTGILTPEQKTKLEEMIKSRRASHGMFGRQKAN